MSESTIEQFESEGGSNPPQPGTPESPVNGIAPAAGAVPNGTDPDAPFGRKRDGTPRKSRAGRPSAPAGANAATLAEKATSEAEAGESIEARRERLGKVRQAPESVQSLPVKVSAGVDHQALGLDCAMLWITVGSMLFGPAWAPDHHTEGERAGRFTQDGQQEVIALRDAFGAVLKQYDIDKIPPTIQLAVVLTVYVGKRAQKPEIRSRLSAAWQWTKSLPGRAFGIFRRG